MASDYINALLKKEVTRTPIWVMRQAGRYLPEYRETRKKAGGFLSLCKSSELACEVTLQPLERFDFDAAILFSDILTIPDAMGLGLYFVEGEGPKFSKPLVRTAVPVRPSVSKSPNTPILSPSFSAADRRITQLSMLLNRYGSLRSSAVGDKKWLASSFEVIPRCMRMELSITPFSSVVQSSSVAVGSSFQSAYFKLLEAHNRLKKPFEK